MPGLIDALEFLSKGSNAAGVGEAASILQREAPLLGHSLIKRENQGKEQPDEIFGFIPNPGNVVATLFGIPIGIQLGTAAGMSGFSALAVDILTDPLTYLGGLGALTKAGRAGKAMRASVALAGTKTGQRVLGAELAREVARTGRLSPEMARRVYMESVADAARLTSDEYVDLTRAIQGKSTKEAQTIVRAARDQNVDRMKRIARSRFEGNVEKQVAQRFAVDSPIFYDDILDALRRGETKGGVEFMGQQIKKRRRLQDRLRAAAVAGNAGEFKKFAKQARKLDPSGRHLALLSNQNIRNFQDLHDLAKGGQEVLPLKRSVGDQLRHQVDGMAAPQRALMTFRIPGTRIERTVALGQPLVEGVQRFTQRHFPSKKVAGLVPGARRAARAMQIGGATAKMAGSDTVHDLGRLIVDAVKGDPQSVERLRTFKGNHEIFVSEAQLSRVAGEMLQNELYAAAVKTDKRGTLKSAGAALEELQRVQLLMDNPGKYIENFRDLTGPKSAARLAAAPIGPEPLVSQIAPGAFDDVLSAGKLSKAGQEAGMTDETVALADSLRAMFRDVGEHLEREGLIDAALDHYFPRLGGGPLGIKIVKSKEWEESLAKTFKKRDTISKFYSHGLPRKVPFYEDLLELEKRGIIKIREKDPAKIIRSWAENSIRQASRARLMQRSKDAKFAIPHTKVKGAEVMLPIFAKGSDKLLKNAETRQFYEEMNQDHVRSFAMNMGLVPNKAKFLGEGDRVFVHKDQANNINALLKPGPTSAPIDSPALATEKLWDKALAVNAATKRSLLWFSAFHYAALTESAIADLGWAFFRQPIRAIRQGQREMFEATDMMKFAVGHGLQVGPMTDAEIGLVSKALKIEEGKIPVVSPLMKGMTRLTGVWDRALWDYYHSSLKMFAFSELYNRGLVRFGARDHRNTARAVAEHVNNAFGGQVWEQMAISKGGQRWLRMFLLAPDWTLSNLKVAADIFGNRFKKAEWIQRTGRATGFTISTDDVTRAGVRQFFSRRYALQTALIWGGMASMANFAFTGNFLWDNPEGFRQSIRVPWDAANGQAQYYPMPKQFREPFELMGVADDLGISKRRGGPIEFLHAKMARVPSTAMSVFIGRDYFGEPIVGAEDGAFIATAKSLGFAATEQLPIGTQLATRSSGGPQDFFTNLLGAGGIRFNRGPRTDLNVPDSFGELADDPEVLEQIQQVGEFIASQQQQNLFVPSPDALLPVAR